MIKIHNFDNAKCLKCGQVYENMMKIGVLVMCGSCAITEFSDYVKDSANPPDEGLEYLLDPDIQWILKDTPEAKAKYSHWLGYYMRKTK